MDFDRHEIKTQFLSLFNQRLNPPQRNRNWTGDWLYRRERLTLIDREFSELRLDLLILQELIERIGNPYESDRSILSAGSLKGYVWNLTPVETYTDSGETESLAVTANLPIEFLPLKPAVQWRIGAHVMLMKKMQLEKQDFYVINLKMNPPILSTDFDAIAESINAQLKQAQACRSRVILGAYIPSDDIEKIEKFANTLDLKDVSKDFCNIESDCFTATPRNESFYLVNGEQSSSRTDYIFVSKPTKISASSRNMLKAQEVESGQYKKFGLSASWPSYRFGWVATLRLAKCIPPPL